MEIKIESLKSLAKLNEDNLRKLGCKSVFLVKDVLFLSVSSESDLSKASEIFRNKYGKAFRYYIPENYKIYEGVTNIWVAPRSDFSYESDKDLEIAYNFILDNKLSEVKSTKYRISISEKEVLIVSLRPKYSLRIDSSKNKYQLLQALKSLPKSESDDIKKLLISVLNKD